MQDALLLDELTAIIGSGRFRTLLRHLRTHLPLASAVNKDAHQQCCGMEDDVESLQCDELVAEIEQRGTQLENVLTQCTRRYEVIVQKRIVYERPEYHLRLSAVVLNDTMHTYLNNNIGSLDGADGNCGDLYVCNGACSNKELVRPTNTHHISTTSTHYNDSTSFLQEPASSSTIFTISSTEACYDDEQLGDSGSRRRIRGKNASSCSLTTTTNGGEQQIPRNNNLIAKWASVPHHALWEPVYTAPVDTEYAGTTPEYTIPVDTTPMGRTWLVGGGVTAGLVLNGNVWCFPLDDEDVPGPAHGQPVSLAPVNTTCSTPIPPPPLTNTPNRRLVLNGNMRCFPLDEEGVPGLARASNL
jgi:hypothetical protein